MCIFKKIDNSCSVSFGFANALLSVAVFHKISRGEGVSVKFAD